MSDIIKADNENELVNEEVVETQTLIEVSNDLLAEARSSITNNCIASIPIDKISTLGAGVATLLPQFRTIVQTSTINMDGLFRIANAADGTLKANKTGEFYWGALKATDGTSKMAKLTEAGQISSTTTTIVPINPAMLMMTVALFSIEKKLGTIEETGKQLLSFMEYDKESEIEADVQILDKIINEYKHIWDNEINRKSTQNQVLEIMRTARKNMIFYQKSIADALNEKKFIVDSKKVNLKKEVIIKQMNYYRLSLFAYSMASMIEVMLSGNFNEDYLNGKKSDIETLSAEYEQTFVSCSVFLEKIGNMEVEANVLIGVGKATGVAGKIARKIPIIEKGVVDDCLISGGDKIKEHAKNMKLKAVSQFAKLNNPGVRIFIDNMEDMNRIYNHTNDILIDKERIYLLEKKD